MNTIYKYEVPGFTSIEDMPLPIGAQILSVQQQGDKWQLWALINPNSDVEVRTIGIFGTGQPIPDRLMTHISTFQQDHFVWHAFEVLD